MKRRRWLSSLLTLELAHLLLPLRWGDDAVFFGKARRLGLAAFLRTSSRPLVDSATYLFASCPLLWRVLNPLALLALAWLLARLLKAGGRRETLLGLLLLIPSMGLVDAGFMATTVNYLWPVTCGLFVIYSVLRFAPRVQYAWLRCVLALPALAYAANMQQMAVLLPAVLALLCCGAARRKEAGKALLAGAYAALAAVAAAYSYYKSTAGEASRLAREAGRYFPGFQSLSLPQRLELGFSSTFHGLTMALSLPGVLFLIFCVFLAVMALRRPLRVWRKALSFVPAALTVILFVFRKSSPLVNPKMAKAAYLFSWKTDLVFLLLACAVLAAVLQLIQNRGSRLAAFCALALGAGSRVLMGFSPTVWASGYRTFTILALSLLVAGYYIYCDDRSLANDPAHPAVPFFGALGQALLRVRPDRLRQSQLWRGGQKRRAVFRQNRGCAHEKRRDRARAGRGEFAAGRVAL